MGRRYLPRRDEQVLAFALNLSEHISHDAIGYGLSEAQASEYEMACSVYSAAWARAIHPATRGPAAVLAKNQARDALVALTRELVRIIQAFPATTDARRFDLGITIRQSPTAVPAPDVAPCVDWAGVEGRTVMLRVHDGSPNQRGKPAGAAWARMYSFVGQTYPTDPMAWQYEGSGTRGNFAITFPDGLAAGTQVWLCAAWINRRGQSGPRSTPITTLIQPAGVSGASLKIAA